jgi:hypothetical protein
MALNAVFAYLVMHLQVFAWARRRWPRLAEKRKCLDQRDDLLRGELVGQAAPTTGQRRRALDRGGHTDHCNPAGRAAASLVRYSSRPCWRVFIWAATSAPPGGGYLLSDNNQHSMGDTPSVNASQHSVTDESRAHA